MLRPELPDTPLSPLSGRATAAGDPTTTPAPRVSGPGAAGAPQPAGQGPPTTTVYLPAFDPRVTLVLNLVAAAVNAAMVEEVDPLARWRRVQAAQGRAQVGLYALARALVAGEVVAP